MSRLIIPPIECAEEGCTAADKNAFYCSGCQYAHLPWFEAGADLASGKDQTSYPEPAVQEDLALDDISKVFADKFKQYVDGTKKIANKKIKRRQPHATNSINSIRNGFLSIVEAVPPKLRRSGTLLQGRI